VSLPQIATITLNATFVYFLAFVDVVPTKGSVLEADTGVYSPSQAGAVARGGGCTSNCTQHLPISWNVPTPIAVYGNSTIQADALVIGSADIAYVAAASNNITRVFASAALGATDSWYGLIYTIEQGPHHGQKQNWIAGGAPELAIAPCQLVLTTHTGNATLVTGWANLCGGPPQPQPGSVVITGGEHRGAGLPPGSQTTAVYGVVPLQSAAGNTVDIYGTGLSSAQSVRFGSTSASFSVVSPTHIRATVPGGSGATNVQVMSGGTWSGTNCSTEFTYGAPLPTGTPQVSWVSPSAAATGATVTVYGYNFGGSVYFNTSLAQTSRPTPNTYLATVPAPTGSPSVNVTVKNGSLTSPTTCADVFHYLGPWLGSLSPSQGWTPLTVTLSGLNFSTSATVYFGPNASSSVTHTSSTSLKATLPSGLGSVPVTVRQAGYTSDSVTFTYTPPTPVVNAIIPDQGPAGAGVILLGQYLNSSASVYFGSVKSTHVQFVSAGELIAKAPTGSGTDNVTVHQFGKISVAGCGDEFTYGPAYPSGIPYMTGLSSTRGAAGSTIAITGVNFSASSDEVLFGGVGSPFINASLSNSTSLTVTVPQGIGNVTVEVESPQGSSPPVCSDAFVIVSTGTPPAWYTDWNATLPASTQAVPVAFGYAIEVLATMGNRLAQYAFNSLSGVMQVNFLGNVTTVGSSTGSSIFSQIGGTQLSIPGGSPLQVAAASDGGGAIVLVTADQQGRTSVELLVSNGAPGWSEPYFVTPTQGSASDPQIASTPFGPYYATWAIGGGVNAIDIASFAAYGTLLQSPVVVPGSSGGSSNAIENASLAVDPMGHPILTWASGIGTTHPAVMVSADYESPAAELARLTTGWANVVPADFEAFGGTGRAAFISMVWGLLNVTSSDVSSSNWCAAEQTLANPIYTNVTWIDDPPAVWGNVTGCSVYVGSHHNTILSFTAGLLDADFYLSVQTKWLMEALGVGLMLDPNWSSSNTTAPSKPGWFQPDTGAKSKDRSGDSVVVQPQTVAVNTLILDAVANFPTRSAYHNTSCTSSLVVDKPYSYQIVAQVTVAGYAATTINVTSPGYLASPAFTYLHGAINGSWSATISIFFQTVNQTTNLCSQANSTAKVVPTPSNWPRYFNTSLTGSFTTGLDPYPASFKVNSLASPHNGATASDTMLWQNTVNSTASLWINGSAPPAHWRNGNFSEFENASGGNLTNAPQDITNMTLTLAANHSATLSWWPVVNASEVSSGGPNEVFSEGCTDSGVPSGVVWPGTSDGVTNVTSSSMTLTWFATFNSSAWATLVELGSGGTNVSVSAQALTVHGGNNGTIEYVAEAQGLDLWGAYNVSYEVATTTACKTPSGTTMGTIYTSHPLVGPTVQLPAAPPMFEQDAPYDSITRQGGGATIAWQVPLQFETRSGTQFESGTLYVSSTNSSISRFDVPITSPLNPFVNYSIFGSRVFNNVATTYALNLTGLAVDNWYTVTLVLNYTTSYNPAFNATNTLSFWYERDTTGDGLTDWEKQYGWKVTTTNPGDWTTNSHVTANPNDFATNGLVSDYIEKDYGLNPTTVDSACSYDLDQNWAYSMKTALNSAYSTCSHMLDTWNLTFNLKPGGGAPPTGSSFEIWNESGSYNPFATSVYYSHGLKETGSPVKQNITNITAAGPIITSGDGAPYAARVLWSYSALKTFIALPGVENASWLRAVEGTWKGVATLTVWGKLSWGANPLAASTPEDGLPDGERVNPVYEVAIEVHSIYANQSGLGTGTGYAVQFYDNYSISNQYNVYYRYLDNYSAPAWAGNTTYPTVLNYVTTLPTTQTSQMHTLSIDVVANESGGMTAIPINGAYSEINVSYDLVNAGKTVVNDVGSGSGGSSTLYAVLQEVPVGVKAPTWLWIPTNNATVNALPVGLQRYTGEQSFDLVVVNASGTITSDGIPLPWGGYESGISLSSGMNDFLIPRAQFLDSAFGQGVLLGESPGFNSSRSLPLVNSTEQSYLTGFGGGNLMVDLSAYWQNRSIASGPGNITGSNEKGTPAGNSLEVQLLAASFATASNTGGLASVPSLYSTVGDPSALQSIVTVNITSTATLDLLIASLLDNTTGGASAVNGTLEGITYQVGFLGLSQTVVNAISNLTNPNDGLYAPPPSHFPPPPPPSAWASFWNAVTSIVTNPLGAILSLANTVWNAARAAFTYVNHLAHEAVAIGAQVLQRTAAAIVHVGDEIAAAFKQFLNYISTLVSEALAAVIDPVRSAAAGYASGISNSFNVTVQDEKHNGSVNLLDAFHLISAVGGDILVLGLAVGVATMILFTLLTPLDFGATFVLGILLTLLTIGALFAFSTFIAAVGLTAAATWDIDGFANTTIGKVKNGAAQVQWTAFAASLGLAGAITDTPLAIYLGVVEVEANNPLTLPIIAMMFDMVSIAILAVAWAQASLGMAVIATVVGAMGLVLSAANLRQASAEGSVGTLSYLDLGLSLTGLGSALYVLSATA
jgi:hypothetical protein